VERVVQQVAPQTAVRIHVIIMPLRALCESMRLDDQYLGLLEYPQRLLLIVHALNKVMQILLRVVEKLVEVGVVEGHD